MASAIVRTAAWLADVPPRKRQQTEGASGFALPSIRVSRCLPRSGAPLEGGQNPAVPVLGPQRTRHQRLTYCLDAEDGVASYGMRVPAREGLCNGGQRDVVACLLSPRKSPRKPPTLLRAQMDASPRSLCVSKYHSSDADIWPRAHDHQPRARAGNLAHGAIAARDKSDSIDQLEQRIRQLEMEARIQQLEERVRDPLAVRDCRHPMCVCKERNCQVASCNAPMTAYLPVPPDRPAVSGCGKSGTGLGMALIPREGREGAQCCTSLRVRRAFLRDADECGWGWGWGGGNGGGAAQHRVSSTPSDCAGSMSREGGGMSKGCTPRGLSCTDTQTQPCIAGTPGGGLQGSARQSRAAAVLTPGIDGGGGSDRWSPDRQGAGEFGDDFGVRDALKARYGPNSPCTTPRPPLHTHTDTHLLTHQRGRWVHHRCTTALTETLRDLPQLNALDRSQIMVCVACGCVCVHRHPRCVYAPSRAA